ncbi:MAG: hypothetical protein JWM59_2863 [Verrucomicrobiales bacterium]|nr:hypothetical protein [Verrucomicrobiales bacterium]
MKSLLAHQAFYRPLQRLRFAVSSVCLLIGLGNLHAQNKPAAEAPVAETPGKAGTKKEADRFISMVLLLKAPPKITVQEIAHAVSEGTGTKITEKDIVQKPPYHLITAGSDKFIINSIAEPYFEDAEKLAAELKFHNLGDSIKASKGWMSVDWVPQEDKSDIKSVYQMIGKMVAKFGIEDIIAVYSPDLDEFALWTPENIKGLESEDPLAVFDHDTHAPAPKKELPATGADTRKPDANNEPKSK